jgi:hypothetical protein
MPLLSSHPSLHCSLLQKRPLLFYFLVQVHVPGAVINNFEDIHSYQQNKKHHTGPSGYETPFGIPVGKCFKSFRSMLGVESKVKVCGGAPFFVCDLPLQ